MTDFGSTFDAITPSPAEKPAAKPTWALVEVFGHRQHYGEIRDIEIGGGKLLEVRDVDTGKAHCYGAGAIFSLTLLSQEEIDAHVAEEARRQREREEYERKWRERQEAKLIAAPARYDDEEGPF